jgi:hypothetical protein
MIKKGDKFNCIKLDYVSGDGKLCQLGMSIGKLYEVYSVHEDYVVIDLWKFGIKGSGYIREFDDYFLNIAEWRDKQINSILED